MKKLIVRATGQYDPDAWSLSCGSENSGELVTVQDEAGEADINTIVRRFAVTGTLPPLPDVSQFRDVSNVPDFRTLLDRVRYAEDQFARLPSGIREKFRNDVSEFMEFVNDPSNDAEIVALGLKKGAASVGKGDSVGSVEGTAPNEPESSTEGVQSNGGTGA